MTTAGDETPIDLLHVPGPYAARRAHIVAILLVASAVMAAFAPALSNGLVWDDLPNLVRNQAYRGLSWASLQWMFTTSYGGHYQPLSWLSLSIDARLWGADTGFGFHLTNLLLHALNATLVYFLTLKLVRIAPRVQDAAWVPVAALVAALAFAIHPLRVESVAWATERRDVLSTLFMLLTVWWYLRSRASQAQATRNIWLVLAIVAYVCSLLSKATGMTLPVVLLILDIYPLRRLRGSGGETVRTVILEKLAFALPAVVVATTAVWAQSRAGALWTTADHPFALRLGQACYGLMFYPLKTLWPANLVPLYEQRPDARPTDIMNIVGLGFVVAATLTAWSVRRRYPAVAATWFSYVVLVAPMLGLAQSGPQVVADRYSYVSCIPFAVLFGAIAGLLWTALRRRGFWLKGALLLVLWPLGLVMIFATRAQVRIWKDPLTLWTTTLARAPDTPTAHANLAVLYYNTGQIELTRDHSMAALRRLPGNRSAQRSLALSSLTLGDHEMAEQAFRRLIAIAAHLGQVDRSAICNLATALSRQGRFTEAEGIYHQRIEGAPTDAFWRERLAEHFAERGLANEAIAEYERALQIDPTNGTPYLRVAKLQQQLGDAPAAVGTLERGLNVLPDNVVLMTQLAWVLATTPNDSVRDGGRALALATQVHQTPYGRNFHAIEAFAAAQAEMGQFEAASATIAELRTIHDPHTAIIRELRAGWGTAGSPRNPQTTTTSAERARMNAAAEAYAAGRPMRE